MNLRIMVEYPRTWALIPSSPSWNQVPKFTLRNQASRRLALLHHRGRQISVVAEFISSTIHLSVKLLSHRISLLLPHPSSITFASLCRAQIHRCDRPKSLPQILSIANWKLGQQCWSLSFLHVWSFPFLVIINLTPNSQIIQSSPQI